MLPSDPPNPFARQTAWPSQPAEPTHVGRPKVATPEPVPLQPRPLSRNSIFSGSAIPMAPIAAPPPEPESKPEPAPEPRPSIEQPPPGEAPPPLRTATFVAPAVAPRRSFRRHVPLVGALMTAAAGFAVMAFVMTRPPPELVVPPPHHPSHLAVVRADNPDPAPQAAAAGPSLRGLMQRIAPSSRPAAATPPPEPAATPSAQATAAPAAAIAAPQARFNPPPAPDPDAPIATRPPYS